jgi:lysophospholipase L1-like esterase
MKTTQGRIPFGILKWTAVSFFCLASGIVTLGFFHPDPYALERWTLVSRLFLWTVRVLIPVASAAVLLIYFKIWSVKTAVVNAAVFSLTLSFLLLLLYPIADVRYHRSMARRHRAEQVHPFLQLAPVVDADRLGKASGSFRIFCLGGSTTEFADSSGRDWPSRVEDNLRKRLGRSDVHVFNFGRQWYTTLHMLIFYESNLRKYRPDAVIVMETVNDLLVNADFCYFSGGPFREDYGHFYGPMTRIFNHKGILPAAAEFLGHYWYFKPRTEVDQDSFPGLPSFRRNLNALIDLAQKDGTRVILMTQPNLYSDSITPEARRALRMLNQEAVGPDKQWSYRTALNGFRQYRNALIETASARNVDLIDLESRIPKTQEFLYDDVHYQNKSFDLIGRTVSEELISRKVVSKHSR